MSKYTLPFLHSRRLLNLQPEKRVHILDQHRNNEEELRFCGLKILEHVSQVQINMNVPVSSKRVKVCEYCEDVIQRDKKRLIHIRINNIPEAVAV